MKFFSLIFLCLLSVSAQAAKHKPEDLIANIYQGIGIAAIKFETDSWNGQVYRHPVNQKFSLVFRKGNYESDIRRAYAVVKKLESKYKAQKAKPKKQAAKPLTRLERLMQAEATINKNAPAPQYFMTDFDITSAVSDARQARLDAKNRAADDDIRAVVSERQAAEQALIQEQERKAALQEQASAWQAQLNKQAKERAAVMREWKKQNSFGAHARRIFSGVLQTGISSFTGGLTNVVTNRLANRAIEDLFDGEGSY